MIKKYLPLIALTLFMGSIAQATSFRAIYKDGKGTVKIKFPVATVNGVTAWSNAEVTQLQTDFGTFSATSPVVTVPITPSAFELNLSTCALEFDSADEFLQAQTKAGIIPILEQLFVRLQAYNAAGMNPKAKDIQQRLDYLGSNASGLP